MGWLCVAGVACQQPVVGKKIAAEAPSDGPRILIEDAWVDLYGHAVATFTVTQDDSPLLLEEVNVLAPRFTLATLSTHPVDGLPAWKSALLTGAQTAAALPPSGPGTPGPLVVAAAQQPGSETPASFVDLGAGRFRYVFASALPAFDPSETVRVGVFLDGASHPSARTSATIDFRPSGGPIEERDTVVDSNCGRCHGTLVHHRTRSGVRLCLTCHTWQHSDPDTMDPAALVTTGFSAANYPNPLELGRLVHRIHRGKRLPTLYQSSSRSNPAPALGAGNTLPLPFTFENNTTPVLGRKFFVIGAESVELVPGRVIQRTDNGQPAKTIVTGISFPRDYRDCNVCHEGAGQADLARTGISRRTCGGCHPDVWFQAAPSTLDESHFAHAGGPQADDSLCANCHLAPPAGWKLYAPLDQIHVPMEDGVRYNTPQVEILAVDGLRPGSPARVRFRVLDRAGALVPSLGAPSPAYEPDSASSSFVPRAFASPTGSLTIRIAGPVSNGAGPETIVAFASGTANGNPDPALLTTDATTDEYVYTFTSTVPPGARENWWVSIEGRRRLKYGHYDPGSDTFRWPYTGETVTESPDNPVASVNTVTGSWPPDGPAPRRKIVSFQSCLRCHARLEAHSRTRHNIELCVFCHTPTQTDWGDASRKKTAAGLVDLTATYDGIEERSVHYTVMMHRFHTGARTGVASIEAIQPHIVSGKFWDDIHYPNDLANCTACHVGKSYLIEAIPSNAAPTVANETASDLHAPFSPVHAPGEATPPITSACVSCHDTGASQSHVANYSPGGVERCAQCHTQGPVSVEVAHGLAPANGTVASASFTSIAQTIFGPRCASAACHGAGATPPVLEATQAYAALVNVQSPESPLVYVKPGAPEQSYLVHKLRGTATTVGGSGSAMPPEGALPPADISAIEDWIAKGAPKD
jgi:OmcA/MtrC family decaheme c-type cytochrome